MKQPGNLIDPQKLLRAFPPTEPYLIGVSGGRDSIALLHLLIGAGYRKLIVCHLNHQLRGRSSNADARFVKNVIGRYSEQIVGQALRLPSNKGKRGSRPTIEIELELGSTDIRALAKQKKLSLETAARQARYAFFSKVAKRRRCSTIFLAHHADDLVETFLWNLFRGAGLTGLAGMREVSTRRSDGPDLVVVRPLLGVWRADIDGYVRRHRLKFREDASNKDVTPMRNRIRHRLLPSLEKTMGRNLRQNIWRTATIAAEEENFFQKLLPDQVAGLVAVEPLRKMSPAVQRRVLHKWLRTAKVTDVGFDLIERVRALLDPINRVAKVNLPQNRHVRRRAKKIFIEG